MQQTSLWLRISDWTSDVCSSDLPACAVARKGNALRGPRPRRRKSRRRRPHRRDDGASDPHQSAARRLAARREALPPLGGGPRPHPVAPARCLRQGRRSEEHTSELQSLMRISYAVFCLKKKKNIDHYMDTHVT